MQSLFFNTILKLANEEETHKIKQKPYIYIYKRILYYVVQLNII